MIDTSAPIPQKPTMTNNEIVSLLRNIVTAFTRHPEHLQIEFKPVGSRVLVNISADRDDHPRLVGSRGAMVLALQAIVCRIGAANGIAIRFTLLEPTIGQRKPPVPYQENPDWKPHHSLRLLQATVNAMTRQPGATAECDNSNAIAVMGIRIPPQEKQEWNDNVLITALDAVWHAIGKHQGRHVVVEVL